MRARPATSAIATTGRLTRKTAPQLKCSSSRPPAVGPIATPRPETAAQMPIAFARSPAGNTFVRIESVAGIISAPPTPMSPRVAMSASALDATAERAEPAPNTSRPVASARRRPKRSPRLPIARSRPANTSR
jgi:hypothetical protein